MPVACFDRIVFVVLDFASRSGCRAAADCREIGPVIPVSDGKPVSDSVVVGFEDFDGKTAQELHRGMTIPSRLGKAPLRRRSVVESFWVRSTLLWRAQRRKVAATMATHGMDCPYSGHRTHWRWHLVFIRNPSSGHLLVTTQVPSFLRVHRDEESASQSQPKSSRSQQFWNAFSAATGWRVDRRHGGDELNVLPAGDMDLMATEPSESQPPVVFDHARKLAFVAEEMSVEIDRLQHVVRRQEIELASHAAVQISPERAESVSGIVENVLQRAIAALGFDSAAIYMLDDDTQHLLTRAVVGLPIERLQSAPRQLRGSRADLEAMVQEAVVMENLAGSAKETWKAPEEAGAAICTALMKGDLPIGTVWLFSNKPRKKLGDPEIAIAKMTSEQITLHLADASRGRLEQQSKASVSAVRALAAWQYAALPVGNRLAKGWFVDGMIESPRDWAIGWHSWDVLPDGSLMIAMAESLETLADGAMVAATARAALTAHCGYRHCPQQMLQRVGDTLWQTNSADQLVSLMYARLDPETGEGEVASAGDLSGLIAGRYGYRPLVAVGSRPLASSIDVDCFYSTFTLAPGETLLGFGSGLGADGIGQDLIGCCLRSAAQSGEQPLAVLRRELAAFPNRHERGILALSREN